MRILAINPGSTSTKIAVFDDIEEKFTMTIRHSVEELAPYEKIIDQYDFRKQIILDILREANFDLNRFDAIVGRGGLLKPIPGGVYKVNDELIADLGKELLGEHASNLGGILAREIANEIGKNDQAYIVDPVVVDELDDVARFSGHPKVPRISIFHALNQKAVARRYAREMKKRYEDLNLIVVHLGGGITVGAHKQGRVVDVNNGLDGDGPFSPERAGSLPSGQLVKLCFSRRFELHEVRKMITGKGGCVAYLGTNNAYEVEKRALAGDEEARKVFESMIYQICKEIGACSTVLYGEVNAILVTGGMAKSDLVVDMIRERTEFISEVIAYPGEDEMEALAESVYFATMGEQPIKEYV